MSEIQSDDWIGRGRGTSDGVSLIMIFVRVVSSIDRGRPYFPLQDSSRYLSLSFDCAPADARDAKRIRMIYCTVYVWLLTSDFV